MKLLVGAAFVASLLATSAASADALVSPYLYLNRCTGGCMVHAGTDDARASASSIPCNGTASCGGGGCQCQGGAGGDFVIGEFEDSQHRTGAAADAEWNMLLHCVQEVYSPYAITVSDVPPPGGLSHSEGIVGGVPTDIGYPAGSIGGIAPGTLGCGPQDNVISFTFANIYGGTAMQRTIELCYVVSQESAHAFGVPDHSYMFTDGQSACIDPMSYRGDCGGQRFFRNKIAICGENGPRSCKCPNQNSHQRLLSVFGPATPITSPPMVTVDQPATGSTIATGGIVFATASAQRGIFRMELWLNGYKWLSTKGAPWGANGQPATQYPLMLPATVPDGVIDIQVKAYDDLEAHADSSIVTVTKGAPCTSATSCLKGQKCDAGKCFWDAPTGKVGDSCGFPQFCVSGNCLDASDGKYCSQDCVVGVSDSCPMGFVCQGTEGQTGTCVHEGAGGGCCSASDDGKSAALLSLLLGAFLIRRRKR